MPEITSVTQRMCKGIISTPRFWCHFVWLSLGLICGCALLPPGYLQEANKLYPTRLIHIDRIISTALVWYTPPMENLPKIFSISYLRHFCARLKHATPAPSNTKMLCNLQQRLQQAKQGDRGQTNETDSQIKADFSSLSTILPVLGPFSPFLGPF